MTSGPDRDEVPEQPPDAGADREQDPGPPPDQERDADRKPEPGAASEERPGPRPKRQPEPPRNPHPHPRPRPPVRDDPAHGGPAPDEEERPAPPPRSETGAPGLQAPNGQPEAAQVFNLINQHLHGTVHAPHAQFGVGAARETDAPDTGTLRATGRMDADEVAALLRPYVRPDCFARAADALDEDHVVVLTGPQGSGKRSGAVALLREVAGPDALLVVLSPDHSLENLAGREFLEGYGYVLLDRAPDDRATSRTADFDWRRIRDQVRANGARLVVTSEHPPPGAPPESVQHLEWTLPDLADVLRVRLFTGRLDEARIAEAVELMPDGCTVAEVATAAARILAGGEPGTVWERYGSRAARPVREWFTTDRSLREIAEITTLAFVPGAGRRLFEVLQEMLEPALAPAFPAEDLALSQAAVPYATAGHPPPAPVTGVAVGPATPVPGTDRAPQGPPPPLPDRRRSIGRNVLVTTEQWTPGPGAPARSVVVFRNPRYRQWVLEELWEHHSTAYWDGVRSWVDRLVRAERTEPELLTEVALGLALLARPAFDEVVGSYLLPWARGEAGAPGRSTAVTVLHFMAGDSTLAATALAFVRGWAQSGNKELRTTAALAFSVLGVTFPTDAVKWLWHLISQGHQPPALPADRRAVAPGPTGALPAGGGPPRPEALPWTPMLALAHLFAVLTDYGEDAGAVLRPLAERLRRQAGSPVTTAAKVVAYTAAVKVLDARVPRSGAPAVALLAGGDSPALAQAAELLARVLCFRPHRAAAMDVLHGILRGLPFAGDDPAAAARRLGRATAVRLPAQERLLLAQSLHHSTPPAGPRGTEVLAAFLDAVRPPAQPRRRPPAPAVRATPTASAAPGVPAARRIENEGRGQRDDG
ncbi:hypothetical protein ACF065_26605 [Streptomyces sp. NPDC015232]|uniref:hypothetical protein n=1 Tax=unclassified Streptomyces TaxID=2593676 RepID=UPI0036F7AEAE